MIFFAYKSHLNKHFHFTKPSDQAASTRHLGKCVTPMTTNTISRTVLMAKIRIVFVVIGYATPRPLPLRSDALRYARRVDVPCS